MEVGKLSESFRGLATHFSDGMGRGIKLAEAGMNAENMMVELARLMKTMLEGMARVLEASPITIPSVKIPEKGSG